MSESTQFHLELENDDNINAALMLLTLSSSCPEPAIVRPNTVLTPPQQPSFRFSFESEHFISTPIEKGDDLLSIDDDSRTSGFSEIPLSESAGSRKQQHRISKKCHGCGLFKKRVYRYLGASSSFCNACNQHWRRHAHSCPICTKLHQAGASEELRGIDIGGKGSVPSSSFTSASASASAAMMTMTGAVNYGSTPNAASSVGSPGSGIAFLASHRGKPSPTGPRPLQRTHWQINPQGQSL